MAVSLAPLLSLLVLVIEKADAVSAKVLLVHACYVLAVRCLTKHARMILVYILLLQLQVWPGPSFARTVAALATFIPCPPSLPGMSLNLNKSGRCFSSALFRLRRAE